MNNMKNLWKKKLFFSYLPIFFVTVLVLLLMSFLLISQILKKDSEQSDYISTKYFVDQMERSLKSIENDMTMEIVSNNHMRDFFYNNSLADPQLVNFDVSNNLFQFMGSHPTVASTYLYRKSDQLIVTQSMKSSLDSFYDRNFVVEQMKQLYAGKWMLPRAYKDNTLDSQAYKVVTMTKPALLPLGQEGLVVINVNFTMLEKLASEMVNPDVTNMQIRAGDDVIYSTTEVKHPNATPRYTTTIHSNYLGWDVQTGIIKYQLFSWISIISYVWAGLGGLAIFGGILLLYIITKRNYMPIERIWDRVEAFQKNQQVSGGAGDFSFIESALDQLIEQASEYESHSHQNLILQRKQFFEQLIEGESIVTPEDWDRMLKQLRLQGPYSQFMVVVVELDRYTEFCSRYSVRDQKLLKFALMNVMDEMSKSTQVTSWSEWMGPNQFNVLFLAESEASEFPELVRDVMERYRVWVAEKMKFTVTVGLGDVVDNLMDVHSSSVVALEGLKLKMALGENRIIPANQAADNPTNDFYGYLVKIRTMVQEFSLGNEKWKSTFEDMMGCIQEDRLKAADIHNLMEYLMYLMNQEVAGEGDALRQPWESRFLPHLNEMMKASETVESLKMEVGPLFAEFFEMVKEIRNSHEHANLIIEIKSYIQEQYSNPELSLNHLSDRFNMNPKNLSKLFIEEANEKFVDFLVDVRMNAAKLLLEQTDESLIEISLKVGYMHHNSFGRTFKRIVGISPGDYRKWVQK